MKPILEFLPSKILANARCVYNSDEMIMECKFHVSSGEAQDHDLAETINQQFHLNEPSDLLLIAGTLTLTFSGSDHHLSGLDAYTNKKLWKVSKIREVPVVEGRGLLVADPTSFEADRLDLSLTPRFEQAGSQEWVRIVFREDETASHFKVANNLIAGLKEGAITDIYALKVDFS